MRGRERLSLLSLRDNNRTTNKRKQLIEMRMDTVLFNCCSSKAIAIDRIDDDKGRKDR